MASMSALQLGYVDDNRNSFNDSEAPWLWHNSVRKRCEYFQPAAVGQQVCFRKMWIPAWRFY